MEIRGQNNGNYNAGYLAAVQREIAPSVKTNVFKELGDLDENATALMANADVVDLSPEAKAYLKALQRWVIIRTITKIRKNSRVFYWDWVT